jgi:hypothetical protein
MILIHFDDIIDKFKYILEGALIILKWKIFHQNKNSILILVVLFGAKNINNENILKLLVHVWF